MGKKRNSDAARLDEVDRHMYSSFCNAANSLSQLYSHSSNQQRLSFQAGERHAVDKLFQWILKQDEDGTRVTPTIILSYLQNEIEHGSEDTPVSPRLSYQHIQAGLQPYNLSVPVSSCYTGPPSVGGQGARPSQAYRQAKNSIFSNALSSPVCHSLQNLTTQGSYDSTLALSTGNTNHPNQHNRDNSPPVSNYSMDMHAD